MTRQRGCHEAGGRGDANTRLLFVTRPIGCSGLCRAPRPITERAHFFNTNGFTAFPRRAESRLRVVKPCASHADGLALVNIHSSTKQITMTLQPVCTLIVFPGITNNLYGDPTCIKFCRQQPCLASSPFRSPLLLSAAINPQRRTKVQRLRALLRTRRRTQPPGKKLPIRAA